MASVRRYSPHLPEISQPSLKNVLERIQNGEIRLPSFARDWCWSRDHVQRLLETIALGHPMGFATLVNASAAASRPFDVGLAAQNMTEWPMHLVLDGQQRLTAAYQACHGLGAVRFKTSKGGQRQCFFFDMGKAIDAAIPMQDALLSIKLAEDDRPGHRTAIECFERATQYELGIVPTNVLLRFETYELGYEQYWSESSRSSDRPAALEKLRHFRAGIVEAFERYRVPLQLFEQSMSPRRLCSAYALLNGRTID